MAVDLRIEVFSVDLYRSLWFELGLKDFVVPRLKNYDKVTDQIACSDAVIHAVLCRRSFFSTLLCTEIYFDYEAYSKSSIEFYLYLQDNIDKFLPYELNIFDKLLMVCAMVLEIGYSFHLKFDTMYTYNCPLCFAMYFDIECKEEFYNEGGWRGLELHANNYKARVLTNPHNGESIWCSKSACCEALAIEYCFNHVNRVFREKILTTKNKISCPQCLPLLHMMRILFGTSDEVVNGYQKTEGYLQIILRMLSQEELKKREKHFLEGTKFETLAEIIEIGNSYFKPKIHQDDELIPYEKCLEFLNKYRNQNTEEFLSRLFKAHDDLDETGDRCMFCARNVSELPKMFKSVRDFQIERIKSVIYDTVIDVELKGDEATEVSLKADNRKNPDKKEDDDVNKVLKLFFSLGVDPLKSSMLINMEKISKNQNNVEKLADSLAKMQIQKAPEYEAKEKAGKRKGKKNKK